MSTPLLVRHPAPYPTESLAGYVLRLSEINGYTTPLSLYRLAGMEAKERSWTNFAYAKFAAIANLPVSELMRIGYEYPESDHPMAMASDKLMTASKVCPACVADKGFIEVHWHLHLMAACPIHRQAAVWRCGNCKKKIPWLRRGLLTCKCGDTLKDPPQYIFLEEDWWLLDLIRRKALRDPTQPVGDPRMPGDQLAKASLDQILSLVNSIGKAQMMVNRNPRSAIGKPLLKAAASVLTDWPSNFYRLLKALYPYGPGDFECQAPGDCAGIYNMFHSTMQLRWGQYRVS